MTGILTKLPPSKKKPQTKDFPTNINICCLAFMDSDVKQTKKKLTKKTLVALLTKDACLELAEEGSKQNPQLRDLVKCFVRSPLFPASVTTVYQ